MIPKMIHLIWFGDREPEIPYLNKIRNMYKDYEIKIWRDKDFDFSDSNSFVKKAVQSKKWSFVSDYYRMLILKQHGGIYLDTDMDPIEKLDSSVLNNELILGYEYRNNITMGLIASEKESRFINDVIDYYNSMVDCEFFPLGNLVWTEILKHNNPWVGKANKTKQNDRILIYDRNHFGLWSENKNRSLFIHRHKIDWIDSKFIRESIRFMAKFSKITPAWIGDVMAWWQKVRLSSRFKKKLNKKSETLYFNKELSLQEMYNHIMRNNSVKKVRLNFYDVSLVRLLKKLENVKSVHYNKKITTNNQIIVEGYKVETNISALNRYLRKYEK